MRSFISRAKLIHFVLVVTIVLQAIPLSKSRAEDDIRLENVRSEVSPGKIIVYYDLIGPRDEGYEVTLTLRRQSDKSFAYTPKILSGDLGRGLFAGRNRKVIWDTSKEFPQGLGWDDYYFVVSASFVSRGSNVLLWIGAALLAGGAATYFLLTKDKEASPTITDFPSPQGRPR